MTTQWWPTADASTVAPVEDHDDLREAVQTILDEMASHAAIREAAASPQGYSAKTWSALTEDLGLAAIAISEDAGGLGRHRIGEDLDTLAFADRQVLDGGGDRSVATERALDGTVLADGLAQEPSPGRYALPGGDRSAEAAPRPAGRPR